jgi:TetR/AcrR family transcriptional repressor of nem operon
METFRAKGFEATSMQDLVDGMGINRQSLYDTFGPKEALYHAALERYLCQNRTAFATLLDGPLPLRRALAAQFDLVVGYLLSPDGQPCFLAQAALERAASDPASAQCVQGAFNQSLRRLEDRLKRAQAEGELGPHHDPAALARFFQNTLFGLQITARSGASRADLEAIVRVNLSVLG